MKILIIEDHPIVISGFRALMAREGIEVVCAQSAAEGLDAHASEAPDGLVIDVNLPDGSGFDVTRKILKRDASAKVLIFTMSDSPVIAAKAVRAGAKGFFSKTDDPTLMAEAVRTVVRGGIWLPNEVVQALALGSVGQNSTMSISTREFEVLRLLAKGRSLSEIAQATAVSYKTITNDCAGLRDKLNARTTMELVRIAIQQKLIWCLTICCALEFYALEL